MEPNTSAEIKYYGSKLEKTDANSFILWDSLEG